MRLAESGEGRISEGLVTRFVVRRFFDRDVDLYEDLDIKARVIAVTGSTVVVQPLVSPEALRFCVYEGSGEEPPE